MSEIFSIAHPSSISQQIKKSDFICRLFPITSETEAKAFILQTKQQESKANHNCYAYILGKHFEVQRASDDGEPSGTAGAPILNVLKQEHMTNVLAIVTRYFGGIKLGAGGLIRAYGGTTSLSFKNAALVQLVQQRQVELISSYANFDQLQYQLDQLNITPLDITYTEKIAIKIAILDSDLTKLKTTLGSRFNSSIEIVTGDKIIAALPLKSKNDL